MTLALWLFAAYFTGSIPSSYIAGRIAGVDLRQHGSKNLGATNVYRVLGWRYAIPVGLVDVAKGAIPVAVYAPHGGEHPWLPMTMGLAAVLGHVFSVFMRFRGGKGVATAAGAVLGLAPVALGLSAMVWLAVLAASGYVSLASMLGAVAFPVGAWLTAPNDGYTLVVGVALALFIVVTHRSNIRRLAAGTENRFRRGNKEVS
jgi:glycerol-3-phosphate acyltransferase PlsY